ncbi:hypothetical protein PROFUN_15815 [Planoprotostelium fungivorum]|uniref:Uncharacterized protein n=1 Tax=Planoprotostelium fungivorum TaxID=1890364 RepID=A0A2P6MU78_9EUKA|nr:hypothetical protein PROFUN_15815 [Planoprotostelium fungivorum]
MPPSDSIITHRFAHRFITTTQDGIEDTMAKFRDCGFPTTILPHITLCLGQQIVTCVFKDDAAWTSVILSLPKDYSLVTNMMIRYATIKDATSFYRITLILRHIHANQILAYFSSVVDTHCFLGRISPKNQHYFTLFTLSLWSWTVLVKDFRTIHTVFTSNRSSSVSFTVLHDLCTTSDPTIFAAQLDASELRKTPGGLPSATSLGLGQTALLKETLAPDHLAKLRGKGSGVRSIRGGGGKSDLSEVSYIKMIHLSRWNDSVTSQLSLKTLSIKDLIAPKSLCVHQARSVGARSIGGLLKNEDVCSAVMTQKPILQYRPKQNHVFMCVRKCGSVEIHIAIFGSGLTVRVRTPSNSHEERSFSSNTTWTTSASRFDNITEADTRPHQTLNDGTRLLTFWLSMSTPLQTFPPRNRCAWHGLIALDILLHPIPMVLYYSKSYSAFDSFQSNAEGAYLKKRSPLPSRDIVYPQPASEQIPGEKPETHTPTGHVRLFLHPNGFCRTFLQGDGSIKMYAESFLIKRFIQGFGIAALQTATQPLAQVNCARLLGNMRSSGGIQDEHALVPISLALTQSCMPSERHADHLSHELRCCNHPWVRPYVIDLLFVFVPLTFLKLLAIVQPSSLLLLGGNQNAPGVNLGSIVTKGRPLRHASSAELNLQNLRSGKPSRLQREHLNQLKGENGVCHSHATDSSPTSSQVDSGINSIISQYRQNTLPVLWDDIKTAKTEVERTDIIIEVLPQVTALQLRWILSKWEYDTPLSAQTTPAVSTALQALGHTEEFGRFSNTIKLASWHNSLPPRNMDLPIEDRQNTIQTLFNISVKQKHTLGYLCGLAGIGKTTMLPILRARMQALAKEELDEEFKESICDSVYITISLGNGEEFDNLIASTMFIRFSQGCSWATHNNGTLSARSFGTVEVYKCIGTTIKKPSGWRAVFIMVDDCQFINTTQQHLRSFAHIICWLMTERISKEDPTTITAHFKTYIVPIFAGTLLPEQVQFFATISNFTTEDIQLLLTTLWESVTSSRPSTTTLHFRTQRLSPNSPNLSFYSSQQGVNSPRPMDSGTPHHPSLPLSTCAQMSRRIAIVPQFTYISFATFFSGLPTGLQSPKISVGQQWLSSPYRGQTDI